MTKGVTISAHNGIALKEMAHKLRVLKLFPPVHCRAAKKAPKEAPKDVELNIKIDNIMSQLRKCCNHPYLLEYPLDPATQEFRVDEEVVSSSGKFLVLDRLLPALKKRGHKVNQNLILKFL